MHQEDFEVIGVANGKREDRIVIQSQLMMITLQRIYTLMRPK